MPVWERTLKKSVGEREDIRVRRSARMEKRKGKCLWRRRERGRWTIRRMRWMLVSESV
jgi:hypothetical protein